MRARACLLTVLIGLAAPAVARTAVPPVPCPPPPRQIFIAPMGEPFRSPGDGPAPVTIWFAAADADADGRITAAEMAADADRFFTRLDQNGDGEIAPAEIARYENEIAPEIRLYQSGGWPGDGRAREKQDAREARRARGRGVDYGGALGAGRFTWLNIPEPVAAADQDMNRGISRAEFRTAALARFAQIDKAGAKALTLATLPPVPGQAAPCPAPDAKRARR